MGELLEGHLFSFGNPLLDISANVTDEFLQKYNLPKNEAILAESKHEEMYEDLINTFEIDYSAGGAAQNTLRFAQWIMGRDKMGVSTFLGVIGNDYFGKMMEKKAKGDGVKCIYVVDNDTPTGTCAVLITDGGGSRSLCAYLGAAEKLKKTHLTTNWHWVDKAKVYYLAGHSFSVAADAVKALVESKNKDKFNPKTVFFNLAAPYVSEKYGKDVMEIFPNVDYVFCNDSEALAFAKMREYGTEDLKEIAKRMANEPKAEGTRVAVITQGHKPTLVGRLGDSNVEEFDVPRVDPKQVIDTNGAGDAFTGGFLGMYLQGKPFETCMKCALYCASECIQRVGCLFPKENKFKE